MKTSKYLYTLKIELCGSKPLIWRRIIVFSDMSFFALHVAIQDSFGWTDSHLHQFHTKTPYSRDRNYHIISFPYPDSEKFDDEMKSKDERFEIISQWFTKENDTVFYEYDFGDGWIHKIILEKIKQFEMGQYPKLIDGKNACPPEDCGGIGGYYHILDVLSDPKNKEHEDMCEWLGIKRGDEFNPTEFNPAKVIFTDPKKELKRYEKGFSGR